jgi:RNA polymerase sigma factor (sigma-70 family)
MNDAQLVSACLGGDPTAWDALTERYAPLVFNTALRMGLSEHDAEDVMQNVFLSLLNSLGDLRNAGRLAAWLVTTTKRAVWKLRRDRGEALTSDIVGSDEQVEFLQEARGSYVDSPESEMLALEDQRLVREAMTHLGERCRALLDLLYHRDPPATYAEISQELAMPPGAIGPQRARCLNRLKKILSEFGF